MIRLESEKNNLRLSKSPVKPLNKKLKLILKDSKRNEDIKNKLLE